MENNPWQEKGPRKRERASLEIANLGFSQRSQEGLREQRMPLRKSSAADPFHTEASGNAGSPLESLVQAKGREGPHDSPPGSLLGRWAPTRR